MDLIKLFKMCYNLFTINLINILYMVSNRVIGYQFFKLVFIFLFKIKQKSHVLR